MVQRSLKLPDVAAKAAQATLKTSGSYQAVEG